MSIAEKLTTVAENQRKVYDAGHKAAIDRYCPEFTESGAVVTCTPVVGYPLGVVSKITPIQVGTGDPSPTNVRPISAQTSVKVTIANDTESIEYNSELAEGAYCGNFDWSTGLLTLTHKMVTFTGEESGWRQEGTLSIINYSYFKDSRSGSKKLYGWCSHAKSSSGQVDQYAISKGYAGGYAFIQKPVDTWGLADSTVETWIAYLKEQAAAGTPVQVLYELETPTTVQLAPQEIFAISGAITLYSDTGDTTVTFKADPIPLIAQLEESVISLGGEV